MATVLVVDDEFGITELIDAVLTDEGHHVLTAANGKQGLEMISQNLPDLVFIDYMMPVMDGATMLRALNRDASLAEIPAILMSSMPEASVVHRCSGYAAFLRKPFKISEIINLAAQLIDKRRL
jgi:CheY-like chemotaxis protein